MNREDIIRMALESRFQGMAVVMHAEPLERFAALASEAGAAAERNKLAAWMTQYGFATGHGDTMEQLCDALGTEIVDSIKCEVKAEREDCAKLCETGWEFGIGEQYQGDVFATAIRARGEE